MITTSMEHYRVQPGSRVDLAKWDADDKSVFDGSKKDGKEVLPELTARLDKLQELLWAGQKHKVLLVLQAMDTAGKDGAVFTAGRQQVPLAPLVCLEDILPHLARADVRAGARALVNVTNDAWFDDTDLRPTRC